MKKFKIIIFALLAAVFVLLFTFGIDVSDKTSSENPAAKVPRIGQNLWIYNIPNRQWRNYAQNDYKLDKTNEITLQIKQVQHSPETTAYSIITENPDTASADLLISEGSQEFLSNNRLYTYFPTTFEYFEIVFNGFNFVFKRLETKDILNLFEGYQVIKLSDFKDRQLDLKFLSLKQNYIILNDIGENFYKYYITSDNNDKIKIKEYSNQFSITEPINIKLQRFEGCTKSYPCYEINFMNE